MRRLLLLHFVSLFSTSTIRVQENLRAAAKQWCDNRLKPKHKEYGADEEQLREQYKDKLEVLDKILENRKKRQDSLDKLNETTTIKVFKENMKLFLFFYEYCSEGSALIYGSMGGFIGFNWDTIKTLSKIVKIKFNKKNLDKLYIIQRVLITELNKK